MIVRKLAARIAELAQERDDAYQRMGDQLHDYQEELREVYTRAEKAEAAAAAAQEDAAKARGLLHDFQRAAGPSSRGAVREMYKRVRAYFDDAAIAQEPRW